ncbi:MAG: DUF1177 domain-containing protein [Meiothermus silvanus]|nr:DUF1177 domain-containing protein [Allomeiothermus silvanus]
MLKQVLQVLDVLDDPLASGEAVAALFRSVDSGMHVEVQRVAGDRGFTEFVKVRFPGSAGKIKGGSSPTLGIIGRLGGIGARPHKVGLVSDADGAAAALSAGLKLAEMARRGDWLQGDVIVATHVCPNAPMIPHEPVPFMGSPVDMLTMNRYEVDPQMDAILSIDTTRGNCILNRKGIAITPTAKEGWLLRPSPDLLGILERVTGELPAVLPLSMADITPYGNGVYHINSLMQPATATSAPVVGLPITAQTVVAGSATGASHEVDIALAARFSLEVAKDFGAGLARFYDPGEFDRLVALYGEMRQLQTLGSQKT